MPTAVNQFWDVRGARSFWCDAHWFWGRLYGRPGRGRAGRYATSLGQGFSMRQPRGAPDAAQDVIFHVQDNFGRGAAPFCVQNGHRRGRSHPTSRQVKFHCISTNIRRIMNSVLNCFKDGNFDIEEYLKLRAKRRQDVEETLQSYTF